VSIVFTTWLAWIPTEAFPPNTNGPDVSFLRESTSG
jgi:hypothetical protein